MSGASLEGTFTCLLETVNQLVQLNRVVFPSAADSVYRCRVFYPTLGALRCSFGTAENGHVAAHALTGSRPHGKCATTCARSEIWLRRDIILVILFLGGRFRDCLQFRFEPAFTFLRHGFWNSIEASKSYFLSCSAGRRARQFVEISRIFHFLRLRKDAGVRNQESYRRL